MTGEVFTYLGATLRMPLLDAELAKLDGALGFDWLRWARFVVAHRLLNFILTNAYETLAIQVVGSIL